MSAMGLNNDMRDGGFARLRIHRPVAGNTALITHLIYALYGLSFVLGVTVLFGVITAYWIRAAAAGTVLESHITWMTNTFWISFVAGMIGFLLQWLWLGWLIFIPLALWFAWRVIKGWLTLLSGQPIDRPNNLF